MQTLTFTMLIFAGQGNLYAVRTHLRIWRSRPAPIMLFASLVDLLVVASFAAGGVLMSPLPIWKTTLMATTKLVFTLAIDSIKQAVFARVRID